MPLSRKHQGVDQLIAVFDSYTDEDGNMTGMSASVPFFGTTDRVTAPSGMTSPVIFRLE
jgi:hypothetical protein